jgi:methionyl-tRNA formyltransferase
LQPETLKKNYSLENHLHSLKLDFIVVVAYGKIIPKSILNIPKYGCINIHGSILPKYRGASPVQECLKNGDTKTGLTTMYMSERMDEGNILQIQEIKIDIIDKTPDIFRKFVNIGPNLLYSTLQKIIS